MKTNNIRNYLKASQLMDHRRGATSIPEVSESLDQFNQSSKRKISDACQQRKQVKLDSKLKFKNERSMKHSGQQTDD